MRELMGNAVEVVFKSERDVVRGIMVEVTDRTVYVQSAVEGQGVFAIPRDNIEFCLTSSISTRSSDFINMSSPPKRSAPAPTAIPDSAPEVNRPPREPEEQVAYLSVFVNNNQIAHIPVPPTFNLEQWNDNIYRVVIGNPDVRQFLAGKVQKSIEYRPGKVYIETTEVQPPSQLPEREHENTFSMGGSPMTEYLNPSQMVTRLNSVVGGVKDDEET